MKRWIYAGTFDPITYGHLDVIQRAANQIDQLVVAVVDTPYHKSKGLLCTQDRVHLAKQATEHIKNVSVLPFTGLLVDFAKSLQATGLVRGLRTMSDFEYELSICNLNRTLAPDLETFYIFADPKWSFCSSSSVRELHKLKADISLLTPQVVADFLQKDAKTGEEL